MARHKRNIPLGVFLNGRYVGRLNRESSGAIDFQYATTWLDWEHAFPISLSLPLRVDRFIGAPVVAVFDNLLPDNDIIRRRVAERVHAKGIDTYSLLAVVGRDCVGALQFLPEGDNPDAPGKISGKLIDEESIARILRDLESTPLGLGEDEDFRISLAGAQEKTALLFWKGAWYKPLGSTATTHILKPQIGNLPNGIDLSNSVENEYLCLKLTQALGLPSASVSMVNFGKERVLVVERFDRLWTRDQRLLRLPQEDFCQAFSVPPSIKYEADGGPGIVKILNLLKGSDTPEADREMFIKFQIVFWMLAATDGHAKNFSIYLLPGGRFHMTPLYDVLSAQPSFDAGHIRKNKVKLAMAIGNNRHYVVDTILPRHFIETAEKGDLSQNIIQKILRDLLSVAQNAITTVLEELPSNFPEEIATSITKGFLQRLRILENFKEI